MIEAGFLYACSMLGAALVAMIGCFVWRAPPFPVAARQRLLLFLKVWALVAVANLAFNAAFGPVNVFLPIALAAVGARLLLAKPAK